MRLVYQGRRLIQNISRLALQFTTALIGAAFVMACTNHLPYRVRIPDEFKQDPPGWIRPNGESERQRYKNTYEAFWWNCAILKSSDLAARCPFVCNGTAGAVAGCGDGSTDATNAIQSLHKNLGKAPGVSTSLRRVFVSVA
jgi:hypothetical protein